MAIAQSLQVARQITQRTGLPVTLVGIVNYGDVSDAPLSQIGGSGVFVGALRASLLAGEVDLVVHSLKDLPTARFDGVVLAAVPVRDDPRDALAAAGGVRLPDLPLGAQIGTGSPRRAAQLLALRPDVVPVPVRGNAGTRLARVQSGELAAVVLGYAGLSRIDRLDAVSQVFDPVEMLSAPGQGALAVECRADRGDLISMLACVDDPASRAATAAERSLLAALEAGCLAPVGAYAAGARTLHLQALVTSPDGKTTLRESVRGAAVNAENLGRELAASLLRRGAGDLMAENGIEAAGARW